MHSYAYAISTALQVVDAAVSLGHVARKHGPQIDRLVRARIEAGFFMPVERYLKAQRARAILNQRCNELPQQVDVLAGPTVPLAAPKMRTEEAHLTDTTLLPVFRLVQYTRVGNLTGLPAITVPCGITARGLPISLQMMGRAFDEQTVLRAAHAYQEATPWHRGRPPL